MKIHKWDACFVKDVFFTKINDPYLKNNKGTTGRPHFAAAITDQYNMIWVVPMSSQIEKYQRLVNRRKAANKPSDAIKILKIEGITQALLFQDMFPILPQYISALYKPKGVVYAVTDPSMIRELDTAAQKMRDMLSRGVKFTPTQPNIPRIQAILRQEIQQMQPTNTIEIPAIEF